MKGIVFDFNGTMVLDGKYQEKAWRSYLEALIGREVSDEEFKNHIHGINAIDTFKYFLDRDVEIDESNILEEQKEEIYRKLILEDGTLTLSEGLEELLDELKENNFPITIATASNKGNTDFFFKLLNLDKWFDRDKVIYNDGTFPGKPDPTIFELAFEKLNLKPKDIIIFEDSPSGIKAAIRSGAGAVIGVNSELDEKELEKLGVTKIISDFNDFDYRNVSKL